MITEEIKTKIGAMTADERHELSAYLTKLELEGDVDYWKLVRQRSVKQGQKLVNVEDL